jgi:hypothetical protein
MRSKAGFREAMKSKRNKVGNLNYCPEDQMLGAKLAALKDDEPWAVEHIEKESAAIRASWTASETERRMYQAGSGEFFPSIQRLDYRSCGMRIA